MLKGQGKLLTVSWWANLQAGFKIYGKLTPACQSTLIVLFENTCGVPQLFWNLTHKLTGDRGEGIVCKPIFKHRGQTTGIVTSSKSQTWVWVKQCADLPWQLWAGLHWGYGSLLSCASTRPSQREWGPGKWKWYPMAKKANDILQEWIRYFSGMHNILFRHTWNILQAYMKYFSGIHEIFYRRT